MVAVLDIDVIGGLLDQAFETRNQCRVAGLPHLSRVLEKQVEKHIPVRAVLNLAVSSLDAADAAVRVAHPDVENAGWILDFFREEKSRNACIVAMNTILKPDLRFEKLI